MATGHVVSMDAILASLIRIEKLCADFNIAKREWHSTITRIHVLGWKSMYDEGALRRLSEDMNNTRTLVDTEWKVLISIVVMTGNSLSKYFKRQ